MSLKILRCVSIFTSPAPSQLTNISICVYVGIMIWRTTRHKQCSWLTPSSNDFEFTLNTAISSYIKLVAVVDAMITTDLEFQGIASLSAANILHMHLRKNDVPSSMFTAKILSIPNQPSTRRSPVVKERGLIPSTFTTWLFHVQSRGALNFFDKPLPNGR